MKKYYDIISQIKLFKGIHISDYDALFSCMQTEIRAVKKGEILLLTGDKPEHVGAVLCGQLHINKEDLEGNRTLVAALAPSDIFAEALCCAGIDESPVTVQADTDATVMYLKFKRLLHTCPNSCRFHEKLIENMLQLIALKNLHLQNRMEIIGIKSIRTKMLHYLESLVPKQGYDITIPFNREELSDYLAVDRSALSHELARMKKDGLIDYRKNHFLLK